MITPQSPHHRPGTVDPGRFGEPGYGAPFAPPPSYPPPRRARPIVGWVVLVAAVLVVGGGVAAAVTLSGSKSSSAGSQAAPVNQSVANPADTAGQAGGTPYGSAAGAGGSAGGSGPLVTLSVQGGAISSISYLDANGQPQTVSNPSSGWSTSFQANSSFQEQLRVHGTGEVKCTLKVGDSMSQNASDSTGGTTVTCRGLVGD